MQQVIRKSPAKKGSLLSKILLGVYTVVLLLATLLPTDVISSGGKGWISKITFNNGDKVVHATLFFIFILLLYFSGLIQRKSYLIWISILTGVLIEALQFLTNWGRTFDLWDIFANVIGVLIGWLLISQFEKI